MLIKTASTIGISTHALGKSMSTPPVNSSRNQESTVKSSSAISKSRIIRFPRTINAPITTKRLVVQFRNMKIKSTD